MPATSPLTAKEMIERAGAALPLIVETVVTGCQKHGIPLNTMSLSIIGRMAFQAYLAGAMDVVSVQESSGRSIKQVLEITPELIDAFVASTGGMTMEKFVEIETQEREQLSRS